MAESKPRLFKSIRFNTSKNDKHHQISCLVAKGKWKKLHKLLVLTNACEKKSCEATCDVNCIESHSLLHVACRHQPPLYIVEDLVSLCSDSVFQVDCMNRFPLHVAVKYGSSYDVIAYLLKKNKQAAEEQDIDGRTPLHLVFSDFASRKGDSTYPFMEQEMDSTLNIAELLGHSAPVSAAVEDMDGMNALEYAIVQEASLDAIRMLQNISRYAMLHKRKPLSINRNSLARSNANAA